MFWVILVLVLIVCFVLFKLRKKFKTLNIDCLTLVNGGVKSGKTTLGVGLAIKSYNSAIRRYKIRYFFQRLLHLKNKDEKPLLYSNIPLSVPYVPITLDILLRKKRMRYKSVVLLSESSLLIDSMSFKDALVNEECSLFFKLFGHETKGGKCFIETQCLNDNHYAIKRAIQRYIWIYSCIKFIPFIIVLKVREMLFSDNDGSNVANVFNADVEDTVKWVVLSKSVWKKFDCYCYSKMTDDLPVECDVVYTNDLKLDRFVSFKKWRVFENENK